ncbi:hypothetical protein [Streptomyces klenkii]
MSAAPAEPPISSYRTQVGEGPRTITDLRTALAAVSVADREAFEANLGALELGDSEGYDALVRQWRHRLIMRTNPAIRAAIARSSDPTAPRITSEQILDDLGEAGR